MLFKQQQQQIHSVKLHETLVSKQQQQQQSKVFLKTLRASFAQLVFFLKEFVVDCCTERDRERTKKVRTWFIAWKGNLKNKTKTTGVH